MILNNQVRGVAGDDEVDADSERWAGAIKHALINHDDAIGSVVLNKDLPEEVPSASLRHERYGKQCR